jgi:hypothetical protein
MMGQKGLLIIFSFLFSLLVLNGAAHSKMIPFETIDQGSPFSKQ